LLDQADLDDVGGSAEVWEKVVRKLGVGAMPPQGSPRPTPAALDGFATWLAASLDAAAAAHPNPGHKLIHRLNRTEYHHAIYDLLGLDVDVAALLPPDSSSYGFDNIADILKFSPALIEGYVRAATRISSVALGDMTTDAVVERFPIRLQLSQNVRMEGLPLGTRGGILVNHYFPLDAEYELAGRLLRPYNNSDRGIEGQTIPQDFIITVDGERVHHVVVGGPEDDAKAWMGFAEHREAVRARMRVQVPIKAGMHAVGFTFLFKSRDDTEDLVKNPFSRASQDNASGSGLPQLEAALITGPLNPTSPGDTAARRRILVCRPTRNGDDEECAKRVLSGLARRAYRRPVSDADLLRLLEFYRQGRSAGGFEGGVQLALSYILASPSFVFRAEKEPANLQPNAVYRLSDIELASRLSFFLWSSIPDEELLALAIRGKLKDPTILRRQVGRMLADDRSRRLVTNFTGQWLQLRNLAIVTRDVLAFPDFDDNLRDAMRRETELLFGSIVKDDRNVLTLLDADYTFVNERLAKHYGFANVYGDSFRRVAVTDANRRGLLGQGSILLLTAHPTGATPTIRGKWILSNLMNTPPLPPPAVVPQIAENAEGAKPRTLRERLEEHRRNPVCASCHKNLDPPGFALENFDAVGAWRATDAGEPIDTSGVLADGTPVDSPKALSEALLKRPAVFVGTLTERLLTYALGRGLEPADHAVIRAIVRDAARNDYRFSSLIVGIVNSLPFQMAVKGD
jgi:hypothetical protein